MDGLDSLVPALGGPGLLIVSFVAATLLPFSSELAVVAALRLGISPFEALAYASIGNCLGVSLNYWLGRRGGEALMRRQSGQGANRAMEWMGRYGKWSLLLSWAPVVGDPLTLIAGVVRVDLRFFIIVAFGVRILRYVLLVWLL